MMGLLFLLGVLVQPQVVPESYDWATDVLIVQWIDPNTKQILEVPPANIHHYRVLCGLSTGHYTKQERLAADQLIVGFRMVVPHPTTPTRWHCVVEATQTDGTTGPRSPELSFIVY